MWFRVGNILLSVVVAYSIKQQLLPAVIFFFAFSPAISAIIVRVLITHEGFADAGLKPKLISKWHYYLLSVLWPFAIIAGIVALMLTLGLLSPNLRLTEDARSVITDVAAWIPLVFGALLFTPVMWGEEFGW